jgi:VanZ family protein
VRKQYLLVLALFWTGIILFFCLIKSSSIPTIKIQNLDKGVHVFFHFVFTTLWFLYFKKRYGEMQLGRILYNTFALSVIFGGCIEICQTVFTTTRSGEILDILANAAGALIAVSVLTYYFKIK